LLSTQATRRKALTLMMLEDYSQLPVMTSPRELKGVISWKSVGARTAVGQVPVTVADAMRPAVEVAAASSIFDALPLIARHDYVLIRQSDKQVTGIMSASDVNEQFKSWTEPFLLLEQIEKYLRHWINTWLSPAGVGEAVNQCGEPAAAQRADELSFGDYCQLINHDARWSRLGLPLDRPAFCARLDEVRRIRNRVMHFSPEGIASTQRKTLRDFAEFLAQLPLGGKHHG
jgi:hypothetical protein